PLSKMADSCPYSYRQLSWSVDWHIREETLLAALSTLDNFVLNLPFARMWGDGTSSSSDGMRIETVVKTPNGVRNARYARLRERRDLLLPYRRYLDAVR